MPPVAFLLGLWSLAWACTDLVPDWEDLSGRNCTNYVQDKLCTPYNDYGPNFQYSAGLGDAGIAFDSATLINPGTLPASDVCCGCGAGVCQNRKGWLDSRGVSCHQYYTEGLCAGGAPSSAEVADYAVDNVSAAEACCACGGGCTSLPSWTDSSGNNCRAYYESNWCAWSGGSGLGWNSSWGMIEDYATNGVSAWDACCECNRCKADVTIKSQEELESFAATGCSHLRQMSAWLVSDLRNLSHLRSVRTLVIFDFGGKNLHGLESTMVEWMFFLRGTATASSRVETLAGLGDLHSHMLKVRIDGTAIPSLDLPTRIRRVEHLELWHNPELVSVAKLGVLREVGMMSIMDNAKLRSLHGLERLHTILPKREYWQTRLITTSIHVSLLPLLVSFDALGGVSGVTPNSVVLGIQAAERKVSFQGLLGIDAVCPTGSCSEFQRLKLEMEDEAENSICLTTAERAHLEQAGGPTAIIPNATFAGCTECAHDCGFLPHGYRVPCDYNVGVCHCPLGLVGPNCSLPAPEVRMLPDQSKECTRPTMAEGAAKACEVCVRVQTNSYDTSLLDPPRTVQVLPRDSRSWPWLQLITWQTPYEGRLCMNMTLGALDPPAGLESVDLVLAYHDYAVDFYLPGSMREPLLNPIEPIYPWCVESGDCTRFGNDTMSFALTISEPPTGRAEFQFQEVTVTEGRTDMAVVLFRSGGDYSTLTATVELDPNLTTAIAGVQYTWTDQVITWPHGDTTPKAFVMDFLDDDAYQAPSNLTLRISTLESFLTLVITDDGDAGTLGFSEQRAALPESLAAGECILHARRSGGGSGVAKAQVALRRCEAGEALATEDEDFKLETAVLTWEDQVMGEQCAVYGTPSLTEAGTNQGRLLLTVFEDAETEGDESICFGLTALPDSSAEVTAADSSTFSSHATLVLQDSGVAGGPTQAQCVRGRPCSVDLSQSQLVRFVADEARAAGRENSVVLAARSCASCSAPLAATPQARLHSDYTAGWDEISIDPGQYLVCLCACSGGSCPGRAVASFTVAGAKGGQQAGCLVGQPCQLPQLEGVALRPGDAVTAAESCGETEFLAGFPGSQVATDLRGDGIYTFSGDSVLLSSSGVFSLCWCRPSASACADQSNFAVQVGLFKASGPRANVLLECRLNSTCWLRGLTGTGLQIGDKLMALRSCGSATAMEWGAQYPVATTEDGANYSFGFIAPADGPVLRQLELCWCPAGARCDSPEEFRAVTGSLRLLCPPGQYWPTVNGVAEPEGQCQACFEYQKTLREGAVGRAACVCQTEEDGWPFQEVSEGNCGCRDGFHYSATTGSCVPCNAGQSCQWENLFILSLETPPLVPGFWSTREGSVYRCFSKFTCPYTNSQCASGRAGKACSLCDVGFVGGHDGECRPFEESCANASSDANLSQILPLVTLGTLLACAALLMLVAHRQHWDGQTRVTFSSANLSALRSSVAQNFQYLQLLSIVSLFEVRWPTVLAELWAFIRNITMDLLTIPSLGCLMPEPSAFTEMLVRYIVPVALAAATVVSFGCLRILGKCLQYVPGSLASQLCEKVSVQGAQVLELLMLAGCLFFSVIVRNGFIVFTCARGPNNISTVVLYPHIDCPSVLSLGDLSSWFELLPFALAYNVVFSFGLTFGVWYAARKTVHSLVETDFANRGSWGFLSWEFRDTYTWWLLVKMGRDLLINILAAVFTNLGSVQLLSTAIVSMVYSYWCQRSHPFKDPSNNLLETWCSVSIGAICFFAAGMGYAYDSDNDYSRAYLEDGGPETDSSYRDQILLFFQVVSFVGSVLIMLLQVLAALPGARRRIPSGLRRSNPEELDEAVSQLRKAMEATDLKHFDDIEVTRNLKILRDSPATLGTMSADMAEIKRSRSGVSAVSVIPGRRYMAKVSKQNSKRSLSSGSLRSQKTNGSDVGRGASDAEISPPASPTELTKNRRSSRRSGSAGSLTSEESLGVRAGSPRSMVGSLKSDESRPSRGASPNRKNDEMSPNESTSRSPGSDEKASPAETNAILGQNVLELATQEGTTVYLADDYLAHAF